MAAKSLEWRPGPTVCRCCFAEGCYKDISTEYFWMGKREVYSEMLSETFDVSISYSQSGGPNSNSRLICEPCIGRLRDASEFKRQVQDCERLFIHHLDPTAPAEVSVESEEKDEVKLERVKEEAQASEDEFDDRADFGADDDDDDLDDQPLTKLASKIPKKETDFTELLDTGKPEKRKSSTKTKASPAKKTKITKMTRVVVKPTGSATVVKEKPEKKKKEPRKVSHIVQARRNAEALVQYTTAYPFRLQRKDMMCVYCCEEFPDPAAYRHHLNVAHASFTLSTAFAHSYKGKEYVKVDITGLKCRKCCEPLGNLEDAAEHLYFKHEMKKINLTYDVGLYPFKVDMGKWICFVCKVRFPSLRTLSQHMGSHYQKCTCDTCGRSYLTNEALRYHIKCKHSGTHVCRKCWKEFPTPEARMEHMRVTKRCWTFCCMQCNERFRSFEMKQKHLAEVHGEKRHEYQCADCSIEFNNRRNYYKHYKLCHSEDNYTCTCCGLKFVDKRHLEDHKIVHTGEKIYSCQVCFKAFSRPKSLNQHMWLHSEVKRFACIVCEKQFSQKVSLKGHMKSHHPDVEVDY